MQWRHIRGASHNLGIAMCRLFVHFGFFSKAVAHIRAHPGVYPPESYAHLYDETVNICLRAQSFFSVGLRALYLFIPLVRAAGACWPARSSVLIHVLLLARSSVRASPA
jgi:hypothetical protein